MLQKWKFNYIFELIKLKGRGDKDLFLTHKSIILQMTCGILWSIVIDTY